MWLMLMLCGSTFVMWMSTGDDCCYKVGIVVRSCGLVVLICSVWLIYLVVLLVLLMMCVLIVYVLLLKIWVVLLALFCMLLLLIFYLMWLMLESALEFWKVIVVGVYCYIDGMVVWSIGVMESILMVLGSSLEWLLVMFCICVLSVCLLLLVTLKVVLDGIDCMLLLLRLYLM